MKKTRFLIALLCMVLGVGLLCFAACAPDEPAPVEQTAKLTLSAGEGGSLAQTDYEVKVGTPLAEFVKDIAPTPEADLTFAGWYNGSALLSDEIMPQEDMTLVAKYTATYSLSLYLEGVDGTYGAAQTATGTAIYGEPLTCEAKQEHYSLDDTHENVLSTSKLGKKDTFTAYLKRDTYSIHYYLNAPQSAGDATFEGDIPSVSARYEAKTTLSGGEGFTVSDWFRFGGWAVEANAAPTYQAGEEISLEKDLFLYAVWDKAYFDRFGGGDFLFFPQNEEGVAIMKRAGTEYRGTCEGDTFTFKEGENEIVHGKKNSDGTFVYYREGVEGVVYHHANAYTRKLDEDHATIEFDGYNNITYTVGTEVKHGEVSYDPDDMRYTFTGGEESFDFLLTDIYSVGPDGEISSEKVFLSVGAETGAYLAYRFVYKAPSIKADTLCGFVLNGLGYIYGLDIETEEILFEGTYMPVTDSGVITMTLSYTDGEQASFNAKLLDYMDGIKVILFEDDCAGEYTDAAGNKLTLDGFSGTANSAVWTSADGQTTEEGMYALDDSPLGLILRLQGESGKVSRSYRLSDGTFSELGDGSYSEYVIFYGRSLGRAVLVPGNETTTLYPDTDKPNEKIEGRTTEVEGKKDLLLFTSTDGNTVFEYKLFSDYLIAGSISIYYNFFTYYPVFDEENKNMQVLKTADGAEELLLDNQNFAAVYTSGDTSIVGSFGWLEGWVPGHTYIEFFNYESGRYVYFEYLSGATPSFAELGELTDIYYWYNPRSYSADPTYELIIFDGEEKIAFYRWWIEEEQAYGQTYGSFTYDESTSRGVFTSDSQIDPPYSMRFTLGVDGEGYNVFFSFNGLPEEDMTFAGETPLMLDAYGFAVYEGKEGYYFLSQQLSEDVYRIYAIFPVDGEYGYEYYFDIDLGEKTYIECDNAIGSFYEDVTREEILEFDGRGHVTYKNIDNETVEGTYTVIGYDEEDRWVVSVKLGEESYRVRCYYLLDDEGDLIGHYTKEVGSAGSYTGDKWEYLTIDTFGDAVYTDKYGISYKGEVAQISEHVVEFADEYGTYDIYCVLGENNTFTTPEDGMIIDGDTLVKYLSGAETEIKIPNGVKKIAPCAFSEPLYGSAYIGAEITSLDLNEVEEIGANAFNGCWFLVSVKGAKLKKVGKNAFYDCIELSSLDLPALEEIGEMAFYLCESLTNVKLNSAKIIYAAAFSYCYELTEISLPAAEMLYEGVFYDCFALELVTLGEHLTKIGTPDDPVTGVFERSLTLAQSPLKVKLLSKKVPVIGYDLFAGVTSYTVVVPDIATVKLFYLADSWEEYNAHVGCESEYDGTYYNYRYGVYAFVLDGTLREINGRVISHGAYEVRDGSVYTLKFDPTKEGKYQEAATPLFKFNDAGNIVYAPYNYEDEAYAYIYFKAGEEITIALSYSEDTIAFTPVPITVYSSGIVYEVPAVWTKDGVEKAAKVQLSYDNSFTATMYLKADGNRYAINSLYTESGKVSASLGEEEFDPIISTYNAEDGSYLAISQNDKAGTDITVSFVLSALRDEYDEPIAMNNVSAEKSADGQTYTTKQPCIFAGYSYVLTFTVTGEGMFSYSYVSERQIVVISDDGSAQVVLYQSASGEITSVTLYVNSYGSWTDVAARTQNYTLIEEDSKVYHWLVYEYSYAGDFTLTLTGEGEALTGNLSVGTVVKGYLNGVYVTAFYEGDTRTALYMCETDGVYGKVEASAVTENDGYLTVEFKENTYYVTLDLESKTATIVFADMTYESNSWDDIKGSVRVIKAPDGTTTGMTLTMDEKEYNQYTEYQGDYRSYYIFTDGTQYYYVTLSTSNCSISALSAKTFASGDFNITLLVQSNDTVAGVASATYQGQLVEVTFEALYTGGKDYASLTFTVNGATKNYLANITDTTMSELTEHVLETADKKYRVTVLASENDFVFEVTKFEESIDGKYVAHEINWQGHEQGDGYNYDLGDENYTGYRLKFENENGTWKVTLYQKY